MTTYQHFIACWRAIFADKGAVLLLFIGGIIYSFFYPLPYAYEKVEAVPLVIADLDQSQASRQLIRLIEASPAVTVQQVNTTEQVQHSLWQAKTMALVVIPATFQQDLLAGESAELMLASHGGYLLAGSKALGTVSQAALTMGAVISADKSQRLGQSSQQASANQQLVKLQARPLFNPNEGYGHYVVPAVLVLILQQSLLMGVTLVLGHKTQAELQAGGIKGYFGMLACFSLVALINCLYFFVVAVRLQSYHQVSHFGELLLFSILFSVCIAAFALLLASWFDTRERGLQLLLATAVPMLFLSGYSWPTEALPEILQYLRWLLPSTAGIQGFVSLNQLGASLAQLQHEVLVLLGLTFSAVYLGIRRYH